jgi:hypothetical protein
LSRTTSASDFSSVAVAAGAEVGSAAAICACELADAFAEALAKFGQPLRSEDQEGDDEDDGYLEGSNVSGHLQQMVTGPGGPRITFPRLG